MRLRPVAELDFTIWGRPDVGVDCWDCWDRESAFCLAPPPDPPVTRGLGVVGSTDSLGVTGRLLGPVLLSTGSGLLGTAPSSCGPSPEMENLGSGPADDDEEEPWWCSFLRLLMSGDMSSLSVWLESVSESDCGADDCRDGGACSGRARLGSAAAGEAAEWSAAAAAAALATMFSRSGQERWAAAALEISVLELLLLLEAESVLPSAPT